MYELVKVDCAAIVVASARKSRLSASHLNVLLQF